MKVEKNCLQIFYFNIRIKLPNAEILNVGRYAVMKDVLICQRHGAPAPLRLRSYLAKSPPRTVSARELTVYALFLPLG